MSLDVALASGRRKERRALDTVRLTKPQRLFVSDASPEVLWRDGNQIGKSFALAYDIIHRCRGTHPYVKVRKPPINVLVISVSHEQMVPLHEKIWDLAPKDEIDPTAYFTPGRGISGKPPRLSFTSGPGAGSVIHFGTYKQGATRIAGGTYDLVVCDEPPVESMYGEVRPRVLRRRGHIRIAMTPTPDMPDQTWLRDIVEAERIVEHNYGLTEEAVWPEGSLAPWLRQEEIDEYAAGLLEIERAMRMEGAWEPVISGRWLTGFTDENISLKPPPMGALLGLGIDHGMVQRGKQAMVLAAFVGVNTDRPTVYYLDEYVATGFTTPEQDAAEIVNMLRRNGLAYDDVDDWVGDRPMRSMRHETRKSNNVLRTELAFKLNRKFADTKWIAIPKKFDGSVIYGFRLMNTLCERRTDKGEPHAFFHPRCTELIEAARRFAGDSRDPHKDVLDAARYITERFIKPRANVSKLIAHY